MNASTFVRLRRHPAYRIVVLGLLIAAVLVLALEVRHAWQQYAYGAVGTQDFIEYWSAGQLLLHGENPYNFERLLAIERAQGWPKATPLIMWNPPWLLVWLLPLLLLPFEVAAFTWLLLNIALIMTCGAVAWRLMAPAHLADRLGIAWIATVAFIPALFTVRMGQMSTLLLVGTVGFLYGVKKNRPFLAGLFLGLTTIKPHVLYLLWIAVAWWVITERNWRLVAGIIVTMAISLAVLTVLWPAWLAGYRHALEQPPLYWASPTLGTLLRLLVFKNWPGAQFLPPFVGALLFTGYLLVRRPQLDWPTVLPPLLIASVSTAAYGWSFDHTVLLIPYLHIVARWVGGELSRQRQFLVAVGLVSIGAVTMLENLLRVDDFFFLWFPWALGAVYAIACVHRSWHRVEVNFAKERGII